MRLDIISGLIVVMLLLSGCFFGSINEGNVGVRTTWNKKVDSVEVPPGFYVAVFDSVQEYVGKEIEVSFEDLKPKAKDNLSLSDLDISVFYKVDTSKIAEFKVKYSSMSVFSDSLRAYLPGYALVQRVGRGVIFDASSKHESLTFHTKREEIENEVKRSVQKELDAEDPGMFHITKVVVRQALTDPELEESIRAAVRMQKQVEAKKNELELAKAEAERKVQEADGIARYNKAINESLTEKLLEFKRIEAMQSFAKEGTHTVVIPSDTKPLINVK